MGAAPPTGIKRIGEDATLLIVFNGHYEGVNFKLPHCDSTSSWNRLIDTNHPESPARKFRIGAEQEVAGRSLMVYERVPIRRRTRGSTT